MNLLADCRTRSASFFLCLLFVSALLTGFPEGLHWTHDDYFLSLLLACLLRVLGFLSPSLSSPVDVSRQVLSSFGGLTTLRLTAVQSRVASGCKLTVEQC